MLKLIVGDEKGEVQNANIPVRWCVNKETLGELRQKGVLNPYILLVVVSKQKEMSRQICPLDKLVDYIQFHRPDENKIYATIVWDDKGKKGLWKRFLKKDDGYYGTDLVSYGDFYKPDICMDFAEIDIMVPKELFAKERPEWLKLWVNLCFEGSTIDECHFRKRAIVAFTIQPPAIFLWTLLKIIPRWVTIILLIALGYWFDFEEWNPKKWKPLWNLKPLFRPWRYDFTDLFSDVWGNYDKEDNLGGLVALGSVYILAPIAVIYIIWRGLWKIISLALKPLAKPLGRTADTIVNLVEKVFFKIPWDKLDKIISRIPWPKETAEKKWQTPERKQEFLTKKYTTYQTLLCENVEKIEPIKVVPFKHKIHLQFQDLKAKVCKPMPR